MERAEFWGFIDRARDGARGDQERMLARLRKELDRLSTQEVVAFDREMERLIHEAYTWELWGAAYVIHKGCSDDGFEYFRRWLIACGREVYEGAMADPDSLASRDFELLVEHFAEFEMLDEPARLVHEERTGEDMLPMHDDLPIATEPRGEAWAEDDQAELSRRLPRLWARFGKEGLNARTASAPSGGAQRKRRWWWPFGG